MFLILTFIGSILLLDKYAFGEFGFSQPVVACPLIGFCFGASEIGLFLGILLQLLFFSNLPIGRSIPPDSQTGAILGISSFILLRGHAPMENLLTFCFLIAILGSMLGTYLDILARKLSNKFYQLFIKRETDYLKFHLLGLLVVFLRGFIFLLVFLLLISIFSFLPNYFQITKNILIMISVSIGAANAIYLFYKKRYVLFLLIGVILGCLFQFFVR